MIIALQITGFIFSLIMIYIALIHYKKGNLSGMEIAIWMTVWSVVIVSVAFPDILRTYTMAFAVTRLFDALVMGGFILVITMAVVSYIKVKNLEKKVEELVRKQALKKK